MKRFVRVALATAIAVLLTSIVIKAVVAICCAAKSIEIFEWFFLAMATGWPLGLMLECVADVFTEEQ